MSKRLQSASNSTLPLVSVISESADMRRAKKLLTEAANLKAVISDAEEKLGEIKDELIALNQAYDLSGFRWGICGFAYRGMTHRTSLSREKLVENGVDPEVIAASMVDGEEFVDCRFTIFDLE